MSHMFILFITYCEVSRESSLVGGETPDAQVVDGDDALDR